MEINDPWLAELVRRADEGETALETIDFSQTPDTPEQDLTDKRMRALAEMICRDGNEPETKSAALLVLMSLIEDSAYPEVCVDASLAIKVVVSEIGSDKADRA